MIPKCHITRGRGEPATKAEQAKARKEAEKLAEQAHWESRYPTDNGPECQDGIKRLREPLVLPCIHVGQKGSLDRVRELDLIAYARLPGDNSKLGLSAREVFCNITKVNRYYAPDNHLTQPGVLSALVKKQRDRGK